MSRKYMKFIAAGMSFVLAALGSGCSAPSGAESTVLPQEASMEEIAKGSVNSGASLHDPQIIVADDGTYYCYGTHMTAATSSDLIKWDTWADGVNGSNKIYDNLLAEPFDAFSFVGKNEQNGDYGSGKIHHGQQPRRVPARRRGSDGVLWGRFRRKLSLKELRGTASAA